jgi:putative redox protein
VRGVAALGAPAGLGDWARDPSRFVRHCRRMGVFHDSEGPADLGAFTRELASVDTVQRAREFAPRPLLLLHGTDDDVVSFDDAERIARAHGHAELRMVLHAGRRLRHDPRAVASVLGWLDRQAV